MDHHKHSSRPGDAEHADDYEGSQDGHQSVFDTEEADQFDFGELEKADSEADEKEEMGQAKIPATTPAEEEHSQPSRSSSKKRGGKTKDYGIVMQDEFDDWWWAGSEESPWEPATAFTAEVREDFIDFMGNQGRYSHPRPTDRGTHDVTAYHPDQGSWGEDREDRPDILFQYEKVKKPETELNVQKNPGFLEHQGRIVLAPEASGRTPYRPVLDYPEIPLTLSSVGQGWLMEAISRLNESIILQDFQDRMPFDSQPSINALSMKRSRYRWSSGSLSWNKREGGKVMKDYLDKLIPKHLLRINTTKGLRDLNDDEQEAMRALNKGKYPERRRNKTPPAESGPSSKTKTGKEKAESRSHSRARSRSPRPSPQPQRPDYHRRTPTPEHEETGKGKIAAQGSDREAIQEQQPEQTEGDIDWRDEAPDTYDEVRTVYFALM